MSTDDPHTEPSEHGRTDDAGKTAARPQTLAERYGTEPPNRRRARLVAVAAVVLVLLGWLGWAAWEHGRADVSGQLKTYDVVSPHEVEVTVVVTRHSGQAIVCDVVAQAEDHSPVGEGVITAPAGGDDQLTATATIRTDRAATSVTVSNCRSAD